VAAAEAAVRAAELDLEYNARASSIQRPGRQPQHLHGAFARSGADVFTLVDSPRGT